MDVTSENTFETAIIESLVASGGYREGEASAYSPELGMYKAEVLQFLQTIQPKQWNKLAAIHGENLSNRVIARLYKEMDLRGSLDVIRNGFVDYGVRFKMAYFKPESGLNPDTLALYEQNRLKVVRQVYYSQKNRNSVDLVLSLNGLPVATLELKNRFTRQSAADAKKQYATTRDNKELLFAFKKRSLVHFAVDDETVYMATRIDGSKTHGGCRLTKATTTAPAMRPTRQAIAAITCGAMFSAKTTGWRSSGALSICRRKSLSLKDAPAKRRH